MSLFSAGSLMRRIGTHPQLAARQDPFERDRGRCVVRQKAFRLLEAVLALSHHAPSGDKLATNFQSVSSALALRLEAPTGIEPVEAFFRSLEPKVRLYEKHFREGRGASAPNV